MTPEEIKKEIAEFKEDLQRVEDEILGYYNEYAICYEYDRKTHLGKEPQPLPGHAAEGRRHCGF